MRVPPLLGFGQPLVEVGVAGREVGRVGGRHAGELVRDRLRDAPAVVRVEPVVRVPEGVDVAHRAGDLAGGDLEDLRGERGVEVAVRPHLDLRVAALLDERRQPADLQLPAHGHEEVGLGELQDEAGLGLDEVRVLVAAGDRLHLDPVAAHLAGEVGQVLGAGDDVDGGAGRRHDGQGGESGDAQESHGDLDLEGMGAVGADREEELEEKLVGRAVVRRSSCGGTGRGPG